MRCGLAHFLGKAAGLIEAAGLGYRVANGLCYSRSVTGTDREWTET